MGTPVALGLSVHTGWAACVAAAGTLRDPVVLARAKITMLDDPGRFVFHRASEAPPGRAAGDVERARVEATRRASEAIANLVDLAKRGEGDVVACVIVAKAGALPPLADIISAHPRIHSAEGGFYRDVLREAATALGLATSVVAPKALPTSTDITELLARAGKIAGSPWAKDQKDAALAAWTVLPSVAEPSRRRR